MTHEQIYFYIAAGLFGLFSFLLLVGVVSIGLFARASFRRIDEKDKLIESTTRAKAEGWKRADLCEHEITGNTKAMEMLEKLFTMQYDRSRCHQGELIDVSDRCQERMVKIIMQAFEVKADRETAERTLQNVLSYFDGEKRAEIEQAAVRHASMAERLEASEKMKDLHEKVSMKTLNKSLDEVVRLLATAKHNPPIMVLDGQHRVMSHERVSDNERKPDEKLTFDVRQDYEVDVSDSYHSYFGPAVSLPKGCVANIRDLSYLSKGNGMKIGVMVNGCFLLIHEVKEGSPKFGGCDFGPIGPYEKDINIQFSAIAGIEAEDNGKISELSGKIVVERPPSVI